MSEMFDFSGITCQNYSLILKGWSENPNTPSAYTNTPFGIKIGAYNIKYGVIGQNPRFSLTLKGYNFVGDIYVADCNALSAMENEKKYSLEIYPNPISNRFKINIKQELKSIELLDLNSRRI